MAGGASRIDEDGRRTEASVRRSFTLPTGALAFSLGLVDLDANILQNAEFSDPATVTFCMRTRFETDAFEARALQHELDHLDGALFLDRVAGAHALHPRKVYLEPGELPS